MDDEKVMDKMWTSGNFKEPGGGEKSESQGVKDKEEARCIRSRTEETQDNEEQLMRRRSYRGSAGLAGT